MIEGFYGFRGKEALRSRTLMHRRLPWTSRQPIPLLRSRQIWKLACSLPSIPHGSVIAFGARASIKRVADRAIFVSMIKAAVDQLEPSAVVWYGSDAYGVADYPKSLGMPVHVFPGKGRGSLGGE